MAVGMASGEDTRGMSVPTGPGILGRNWHRAHHILHETLLGASPEGCIQKEGEEPGSLCDNLCGQCSHVSAQPQCLGSICMATSCGHAMGRHGGRAVWLSPWPGHRPRTHNAGNTVQGD